MVPMIGIFMYLVLAIVFVGCWSVSVLLFIAARRKKWRFAQVLAGLVMVGITAFGLSLIGKIAYGYYRTCIPSLIYEDTFGEKPTSDVHFLYAHSGSFFDSAGTDLSFTADHDTFERLRNRWADMLDHSLSNQEQEMYLRQFRDRPTEQAEIYMGHGRAKSGRTFNSQITILMYEPATRLVQFRFEGID